MSRIGKLPVDLPAGVTVTVGADNVVSVKGPLGQLSQQVDLDITVKVEGNVLHVTRPTDQPRHRSMHGLYRALIHNMVVGVTDGFSKTLELVGTGYRAQAEGFERIRNQAGTRRRRFQSRSQRTDSRTESRILARYLCDAPARSQGGSRYREERQPDRDAEKRRQTAHRTGGCEDPLVA